MSQIAKLPGCPLPRNLPKDGRGPKNFLQPRSSLLPTSDGVRGPRGGLPGGRSTLQHLAFCATGPGNVYVYVNVYVSLCVCIWRPPPALAAWQSAVPAPDALAHATVHRPTLPDAATVHF